MEFQVGCLFPSNFEGIAYIFVLIPVLLLMSVAYLIPDRSPTGEEGPAAGTGSTARREGQQKMGVFQESSLCAWVCVEGEGDSNA